jgi:hypothetical protein
VGRLVANGPRERIGPRAGKKEKGRVDLLGWMVGMGEGLVFFSFFSNPFQIFFFQTFLNQIFYIISNSNVNTNSPTILKAFQKPFLNNFSNIFKFKLLHNFSQTFSQLF